MNFASEGEQILRWFQLGGADILWLFAFCDVQYITLEQYVLALCLTSIAVYRLTVIYYFCVGTTNSLYNDLRLICGVISAIRNADGRLCLLFG